MSECAEKQNRAALWARKVYADPSDNDIEIDDRPQFSEAEDGMWVSAWVWVPVEQYEKELA